MTDLQTIAQMKAWIYERYPSACIVQEKIKQMPRTVLATPRIGEYYASVQSVDFPLPEVGDVHLETTYSAIASTPESALRECITKIQEAAR